MIKQFLKRNRRSFLLGLFSLVLMIFAFAGISVLKNQKTETASADTTVTNPTCYVNISVMWPGDNWPTTGWSCEIHVYKSSSGGTTCYESTNGGFNLTKQISYTNNGTSGTTIVATKSDGTWYSFGEISGNGLKVNLNSFTLSGSYTGNFNLYVYAKATCSYGTVTMGSASSPAKVLMTKTSGGAYYTIETTGTYSTNTQYFMSTATGATVAVNQITCSTPTSVSSTTYGTAGTICTLSPSGGSGSYTYSVSDSSNFTITNGGVLKSKATTAAGTYSGVTVTIKDTSGLSKTVTLPTITVNKKDISDLATVTLSPTSYTYSGEEEKPSVTVKYNDTELKENTDYTVSYSNNVKVGKATATVTFTGNYEGSASETFTISKKSTTPTITLNQSVYTYTGSAITPSLTVKDSDGNTISSDDYDITCTDNTAMGIATATVTLKNNYSGSGTVQFAIDPVNRPYYAYTSSKVIAGYDDAPSTFRTIFKFYPKNGDLDPNNWTIDIKLYKNAESYLKNDSYGQTTSGSQQSKFIQTWQTDAGGEEVYRLADNWYAVFAVATFTSKTDKSTTSYVGWVYHQCESSGMFWSTEYYGCNVMGKSVGEGWDGTYTAALGAEVGDISTSLTYGTAADICTIAISGYDSAKTYTCKCDDDTLELEFDETTGKYTFKTTADTTAGDKTVTLSLTDSDGNTAEQEVSFTVNPLAVSTPSTLKSKISSITNSTTAKTLANSICTSEGNGFVVWDWTGFEYINGEYVSTDSSKKPSATLYVKVKGKVISVTLTVTASASGTSYTATAANSNYDLSAVAGVNINNSAYTTDSATISGIANATVTTGNIANTYVEAKSGNTATYSVYTKQVRDQKVISEKIAALKTLADGDNAKSGTQEFYNEKYAEAIDTIRDLIDAYNDAYSSDYAESDLSDFKAIEDADTYASKTAKDALDIAAAGEDGLKTGADLVTQDETLDTALLAYEKLDSSTTAYLADEYKALNDMRKASAIARLNELKCAADDGEELSETEKAINAQIEKDIAEIEELDSTEAITTTITGILEGMTNKKAAALDLEADKTVNGAARSAGVRANIDKQIAAVLALENTTGDDPLATEIAVITEGGAYVCEKIEELEKEQATLTGSASALTDDQKDAVDSLVAAAIVDFNNIPYTDITTGTTNTEKYLTDLADEIFDPLDTKLKAVDTLNTEKKTEQAGDNSKRVIAEIDEAIDKVLALTTDGDDLDEDISAITAAKDQLIEDIRALEDIQATVEKAISGGKFNDSQLLEESEVEALSNIIEECINGVGALEYDTDADSNVTPLQKAANTVTNVKALADTLTALTDEEKTERAKTSPSDNVLDAIGKAIDSAVDIALIDSSTSSTPENRTAVDDYQPDTDMATALEAIQVATLGTGMDINYDSDDDHLGVVEAIRTIEGKLSDVTGSKLTDEQKEDLTALIKSSATTAENYLYPNYDEKALQALVDLVVAKTDAAVSLAETLNADNSSETVQSVVQAAIEKVFDDSIASADQINNIYDSATDMVDGIQDLEEELAKIKADTGISDDTKTERVAALEAGIAKIAALSYSGDSPVDSDEITNTVDELIQKTEAIAELDKSRLDSDGKERSEAVLAEIEKAIEKVKAIEYTDTDTLAEAIADIKAAENDKVTGIEKLEALIPEVEASGLTTGENGQQEALKALIGEGIKAIGDLDYSTTANPDLDTETLDNILNNVSDKVNAALDYDKEKSGASENVQAVLDKAIENVMNVTGDITSDSTADGSIADVIAEITESKDYIVEAIKAEEELLEGYNSDGDISDDGKEIIADLIDGAIEDLKAIDFSEGTDPADVEDKVKELTAEITDLKTEAIAKLDKTKKDSDGTNRSGNVIAEIAAVEQAMADSTKEGSELSEELAGYADAAEKICAGIETLEETRSAIDDNSKLRTDTISDRDGAIDNGIEQLKALTSSDVDETALNAIVDELVQESEAIARLDELRLDDEGKNKSQDSIDEIDKAIAAIEALSYDDYDKATHAEDIAVIESAAKTKVDGIEELKELLEKVEASANLTDGQKDTLKGLIEDGIEAIQNCSTPLADGEATKIENVLNNVPDLVNAALTYADEKAAETSENVKKAYDDAIKKIFEIAGDDTNSITDSADMSETIGYITLSVDGGEDANGDEVTGIVPAIKELEALKESVNGDKDISDDTKEERGTAIDSGIAEILALPYVETENTGAVDSDEIENIVDELTQKTNAIAELDKSRLDSNGKERSEAVLDEIEKAIAAVKALDKNDATNGAKYDPTADTYDSATLKSAIEAITDSAETKNTAIEALEGYLEEVDGSSLTDKQKTTLKGYIYDGIDEIAAMDYPLDSDDETAIQNLVDNLGAVTDAAVELAADSNSGDNSDDVKEVVDSAIEKVFDLAKGTDMSGSADFDDKIDNITDGERAIVEAIKAEEALLEDYNSDKDISDDTKDKLADYIDKAIDDLKNVDFGAEVTPATVEADIAAITTDNIDLKTAAIAELDKSRLNSDGTDKSDRVKAEVTAAIAAIDGLSNTGDDLKEDIARISDVEKAIAAAIEKEEALLEKYTSDSSTLPDGTKDLIEENITAALDELGNIGYDVTLADAETKIADATTNTADIKTEGYANIGALSYDDDGNTRDEDSLNEIATALADVKALTTEGDELSEDIDDIYSGLATKLEGLDSLNALRKQVAASDMTDEQKSAIDDLLKSGIEQIQAIAYPIDDDKVTTISNILTNAKAVAQSAVDFADAKDGASEDVQAVLDQAIANLAAVTGDLTASPSEADSVSTNATTIKNSADAIVAAIEAEEQKLADANADGDLSSTAKEAIAEIIDDAIEELKAIAFTSDIETSTVEDEIAEITTDSADLKTEAISELDKSRLNSDGTEKSSAVVAETQEAIAKVAALTSTGSELEDDIDNISAIEALIAAAIEKAETRSETETDGLSDTAKSVIQSYFTDTVEDLSNISYDEDSSVSDIQEQIDAVLPDEDTEAKIAAIKAIDKNGFNSDGTAKSAAVVAEVAEAINKIDALDSTGSDLTEDIASITDSAEKIIDSIEGLEDTKSSVNSDSSLSSEAKSAISSAIDSAIKAVGALDYDEDTAVDESAISDNEELVAAKKAAISEIDALKDGNSDEVASIANKAISDIAAVSISSSGSLDNAKSDINSIKETAKDAISEQIIRDNAVAEINKFVSERGISSDDERISAKIAEIISDIKSLDRASGESLSSFKSKMDDLVSESKIALVAEQFLHDNPVTQKSNAELGADDKAALESAQAQYDGLSDEEKAAVDSLYQPDYSSLEELVRTKEAAADFNARKAEIIEELKGKQHAHDGALVVNAIENGCNAVSALTFPEGEQSADEISTLNATLEQTRKSALTEISLAQNQQQAINRLEAELNTLIASGQYSQSGIDELNSIFNSAQQSITAVTTADEWKNSIDGYENDAMEKYAEVLINVVTKGDVTVDEDGTHGGSSDDYDSDYDYSSNGYWGIVENESGMTPGIELVIEKKEDNNEVKKAFENAMSGGNFIVQEQSSMTLEEARANIEGKELKATFDVYLVKQGEVIRNFNGTYTVKLLLPEDMRNIVGLQVIYVADDGTLEVLDTYQEGNYLVFTTSHFSEFIIIGESEINLLWIVILEGVIILAAVAAIIIIKRRDGKKGEKAASVALPALLTIILPNGIIPVIIVLGVIAVIAVGMLIAVFIRSRKTKNVAPTQDTAQDSTDEKQE